MAYGTRYTGEPRNSGINNWEVMKAHIDGDRKSASEFRPDRRDCVGDARGAGEAGLGRSGSIVTGGMGKPEEERAGITTPLIDRLVAVTRRAGAVGAKVCGAGGGGCVFFLVERGAKAPVWAAIEREGATCRCGWRRGGLWSNGTRRRGDEPGR